MLPLFDEDFYAPPIDYIEDRTPAFEAPAYLLGWATDRDLEYLAVGEVTADIRERAQSMLHWKIRYWNNVETAHELALELRAYGLL